MLMIGLGRLQEPYTMAVDTAGSDVPDSQRASCAVRLGWSLCSSFCNVKAVLAQCLSLLKTKKVEKNANSRFARFMCICSDLSTCVYCLQRGGCTEQMATCWPAGQLDLGMEQGPKLAGRCLECCQEHAPCQQIACRLQQPPAAVLDGTAACHLLPHMYCTACVWAKLVPACAVWWRCMQLQDVVVCC